MSPISNASKLADFGSGIGTAGAVLQVDNTNKRIGIGTTNPLSVLQVGTGVSFYGNAGIVSATSVFADSFTGSGANLTGIAATNNIITGTAATFRNTGVNAGVPNVNIVGLATVGIITAYGALSATTGTFSGAVNVDDTTDSTSATSGSLIVDGGLGVAKNVYIGAGLSVAGTLTYEDVTSVDSVGLITAKSGVNVTGGQLQVGVAYSVGAAGVCTAAGFVGPLTGDITGNATSGLTVMASASIVPFTSISPSKSISPLTTRLPANVPTPAAPTENPAPT